MFALNNYEDDDNDGEYEYVVKKRKRFEVRMTSSTMRTMMKMSTVKIIIT